MTVTQIAPGMYLVEHDGRRDVIYLAGRVGERWAFWNGEVFREPPPAPSRTARRSHVSQSLSAPMPATIVKVLVEPGTRVKKGDTVVLVEAMKMELPIRTSGDGIVTAVHCRAGQLVQPDQTLVDVE